MKNSGTPIWTQAYSFDTTSGNLLSRANALSSPTLEETFSYDNLDRLQQVWLNSVNTLAMSYDPGRMLDKSNAGEYGYTGSSPHALTELYAPGPDVDTTKQIIKYTPFNKADTIKQGNNFARIFYGPDNQRRKMLFKDGSGNDRGSRYYIGDYEKYVDTSGNTRELCYTAGAIFVRNTTGGTPTDSMYYITNDYLGSMTLITSDSASILQENSYDAWGRRRDASTWSGTAASGLFPRGYTGHEHLDCFGLVNMNGRMYDPLLGRMLSPDNAIQAPDKTENYNRYSYCMNNPLKYTDPTGNDYDYLHQDWIDKWADKQAYDSRVINGYAGSFAGSGEAMLRQLKIWDLEQNSWKYTPQQLSALISATGLSDMRPSLGAGVGPTEQMRDDMDWGAVAYDIDTRNNFDQTNGQGGYWTDPYPVTRAEYADRFGIDQSTVVNPGSIVYWDQDWISESSMFDYTSVEQTGGAAAGDGGYDYEKAMRIAGAVDFTASSTYAMSEGAQMLAYGKVEVQLAGKGIARELPLVSGAISAIEGFNTGWKASNTADVSIAAGSFALDVALDFFEISNPVGWVIGAASISADLYCYHYYGESWTQHAFNH